MKYIVDLLIGKTIGAIITLLAIGIVIFFGTVLTIADILDIIFSRRG